MNLSERMERARGTHSAAQDDAPEGAARAGTAEANPNLDRFPPPVGSPSLAAPPPPGVGSPRDDRASAPDGAASAPDEERSEPVTATEPPASVPSEARSSTWAALTGATAAAPADTAVDALLELKERAAQELFRRVGSRLNDPTLSEEKLHALARQELTRIVADDPVALSAAERTRLIDEIGADVLGFGPLEPLLDDPTVSEIMVNRADQIYVERDGRLYETHTRFTGEPQLRRVIERIVSRVGRRIDESSPLVDARLEDGSRVNAIIPPLAVDGASLTIRKFSRTPFTVEDLVRMDTLTPQMSTLLDAAVRAKLNILVSGGTGTGKTTLLNVLSASIPNDERIVTIEDAVELQLQQEHVVRLESRPANIEGRGAISIRDLVRNSLRMRPDRIVIGEVRGGESLDMLQAMNTGHEGSISTIHANSPRDAISRLETLVLMAGMDLPLRAIREQVASAIDIIVQIARLRDGTRRVVSVTEVQGMEGDVVTMQDAFAFDYSAGIGEDGRYRGHAAPTGLRPRFLDRFADVGITLPSSVFQRIQNVQVP